MVNGSSNIQVARFAGIGITCVFMRLNGGVDIKAGGLNSFVSAPELVISKS